MFHSIITRFTVTLVIGTLLFGGSTGFLPPAQAQQSAGRQIRLSPQSQQTLNFILTQCGMPAYGQQLVLNAVWALGPRADAYFANGVVAQVAAVSPAYLCGQFRILMRILADLPVEYHQAFVYGHFQVTPALERFATQVSQLYVKQGKVMAYNFAQWQTIRECMGLLNEIALDRNPNETYVIAMPAVCR